MNRIALRMGFGVVAAIALGLAIWSMDRLSWGFDIVVAAIAVLAFSYYFEREDPPR